MVFTARPPPKAGAPKAEVKGLLGSPKLWTLLPLHCFYNPAGKHCISGEKLCVLTRLS